MRLSHASPAQVQARIAHHTLPPHDTTPLGTITLLPHQEEAVTRLRPILRMHHGALLADDVGLGKTYVALALATHYREVHIVAPAAILPMWDSARLHTQQPHVQLHSVHAFSRHDPPHPERRAETLVIIDEAHYLRTRTTARYHAVARFVSGSHVLLMSATPLHNRPDELRHLFALFLGARADILTPALLAQVIVRRTTTEVATERNAAPSAASGMASTTRPAVRYHTPPPLPHDRETLTHILGLPAPLPAHDGAVAGALIRLGLLRAWCSSDAALAHALRQRQLRGDALQHALQAGRHPSHAELRSWLVGDHEVQLAFPELMANHAPETGPLLDVLTRHLHALARLADHHRRTACSDAARADLLRTLQRKHPGVPIVAFSQFTQTVLTLQRALADIAGVGVMSGRHARIASGRISHSDALARFAPTAQGRPPPPPHQAIRLLLTTDRLAEGVNLQDAGVVVHLDLPWTPALRDQRTGRCVRIGSPHREVHVYMLQPPELAERVLRLRQRLATKAQFAQRWIGTSAPRRGDAHAHASSAADLTTAVCDHLRTWRRPASADGAIHANAHVQHEGHLDEGRVGHVGLIGACIAPRAGWLAVLQPNQQAPFLLGGLCAPSTRWRVTRRPALLLALLQHASARAAEHAVLEARHRALCHVRAWMRREREREALGPRQKAVSAQQQRARRHLDAALAQMRPIERQRQREVIQRAYRAIVQARDVGTQMALSAWVERADHGSAAEWMEAVGQPLHGRESDRWEPATAHRVLAVLLLIPASPTQCVHHPPR